MPTTIVCDFLNDWAAILREELAGLGIKVPPGLTDEQVSFAYWNAVRRRIKARPRRVLLAKGFVCPREVEPGLAALKEKFENGEDVLPHLSKAIGDASNPNYNDRLLNDWGIHHFHLGEVQAGATFAVRTDLTLFAIVGDNTVGFIDILPHGNWSRQRLFEIMHANWPEVLEPWRVDGMLPAQARPTDEDVALGRKAGFFMAVQLADGTMYAPPGGGVSTTGLSTQVLSKADWCMDQVQSWETWVRENADGILAAIPAGLVPGNPPSFKLIVAANGEAFALEESAKAAQRLGKLFNP